MSVVAVASVVAAAALDVVAAAFDVVAAAFGKVAATGWLWVGMVTQLVTSDHSTLASDLWGQDCSPERL